MLTLIPFYCTIKKWRSKMVKRKSPNLEPTKSIHIKVPGPLFREVKLLLLDPVSGRVRYGEMSKLATSLLRTWVEKQRKEFVETGEDDGQSREVTGTDSESIG